MFPAYQSAWPTTTAFVSRFGQDLVSRSLPEDVQPLEALRRRTELDQGVVRDRPRAGLITAPRRARACATHQVGPATQQFDVSREPVGQQSATCRSPPVGWRASHQGLHRQDSAGDFVGSRKRQRAGEARLRQDVLGLDGGPSRIEVHRKSMGLDGNHAPVLEDHAPDRVDTSRTKADVRDPAAQPSPNPLIEELPHLERGDRTEDGGLSVSDGAGRLVSSKPVSTDSTSEVCTVHATCRRPFAPATEDRGSALSRRTGARRASLR